MFSVEPTSISDRLFTSTPFLKQAYLNIAMGWPPWSTITFLPLSLSQVKALSAWRPAMKKPSFSLIWAKWTAGGFWPFSSGAKPCEGADCVTWTEPSTTLAMPDLPGGDTECLPTSPSSFRNPPAMVAISGE